MENSGADSNRRGGSRLRVAGWSLAALLLLLPLVAMQVTDEVNWTASDFIFAGVLIGGVGGVLELTVSMSRDPAYRAAVGVAVGATFLTIWVNAAVGMIGDEDNVLNLMFAGVLAIALLGAVLARFRSEGMARAMTVAAIAQFVTAGVGTLTDLRGGILSATFAVLWLLSAMLFGKAARNERPTRAASNG